MTATPKIEEDLNFDAIFAEKLARFTESYQAKYPGFKTPVPVDPIYRALCELCMSELMIRARINAAATSLLLRYSEDLDFLFFGRRRDGETLEAFRERMRLNLHMASPAGSLEMYRSLALASANEGALSIDQFPVLDAHVETNGDKILIYLQPNIRIASDMAMILKKVTDFIGQDHIKPAFDLFEVVVAEPRVVNIQARAKLASGKGQAYLDELKQTFSLNFWKSSRLGWNLSLSWIYSQLHVDGIESVSIQTPIDDIAVGKQQYVVLNAIVLSQVTA
jgi:phage-related baseplate assembly protein